MENAKIAKKLVSVMNDCSYVAKNGVNSFHKYKYATAEDVMTKVNEAMTKYNLATMVRPTLISFDEVTNLKGNKEHLATISVQIEVVDSESGESVNLYGLGSGQDAGDKAVMKAQTAAIKYAYMMSLCIATGDDPEADSKTDESMVEGAASVKKVVETKSSNNKADEVHAVCTSCGTKISDKVACYSISRYDKELCMDCQKRAVKSA